MDPIHMFNFLGIAAWIYFGHRSVACWIAIVLYMIGPYALWFTAGCPGP